jgi:hypothetical protein
MGVSTLTNVRDWLAAAMGARTMTGDAVPISSGGTAKTAVRVFMSTPHPPESEGSLLGGGPAVLIRLTLRPGIDLRRGLGASLKKMGSLGTMGSLVRMRAQHWSHALGCRTR